MTTEYETIFKATKRYGQEENQFLTLTVLYVRENGQVRSTRVLASVSEKNGNGGFDRLASRSVEVPHAIARDAFRIPPFRSGS